MAMSTGSEFVDCIAPLERRLFLYYDKTRSPTDQPKNDAADPAKGIPEGFINAMIVREKVFVEEQKVPLENELDNADYFSYNWVAYASVPVKASSPEVANTSDTPRRVSNSTKVPIGTIRLTPPPHDPRPAPDPNLKLDVLAGEILKDCPVTYDKKEPYVKIGRLAVLPEFRKAGISKLLIDHAISFARNNPYDMTTQHDPATVESRRQEADRGIGLDWNGLVLVQAQVGVQKVWRRHGFETDPNLGVWLEEGIPHVGMWRRLDEEKGRRASRIWLTASPLGSP